MRRPSEPRQDGFTLIELIVATTIALVLISVSLTVVVNSTQAVATTKQLQDLNEEARQALNRMVRDVRQADVVVTAVNPDGPSFNPAGLVAVRFRADFDGDSCIGGAVVPGGPATCLPYSAANPEDISYCYQPGISQLFVIDNQAPGVTPVSSSTATCSGGQPILAGNVAGLVVEYRSAQYRFDLTPSDGVTTWRELDDVPPPVGNRNAVLDVELARVDSVVLTVTMRQGGRSQQYRSQIDLRNSTK